MSPLTPTQDPPTPCPCEEKTVPDQAELEILIDELELMFDTNPRLAAQSIRTAFHDVSILL